jgi:hypothetical protein
MDGDLFSLAEMGGSRHGINTLPCARSVTHNGVKTTGYAGVSGRYFTGIPAFYKAVITIRLIGHA